jgi:hypothetical protein
VRHVTGVEPVPARVPAELEKRTLADITRALRLSKTPSGCADGLLAVESGAEPEDGKGLGSQPGLAAASSRATAVSAPKSIRLDPLIS